MEIKEFQDAKKGMEDEIAIAVTKAMVTFEKVTGYSPNSIYVNLYEIREIGKARLMNYLRDVVAEVIL